MQTKYIIGFIVAVIVIVGAIVFISNRATAPSSPYNLEAFAQCLTDKGAKFYGAFWCSHCQATKKMFGRAQSKLPYVECSTPDTKGQLPICKEAKIEGYPTWIFSDNSRLFGELTLEQLSQKTTCPLIPIASSTPQ